MIICLFLNMSDQVRALSGALCIKIVPAAMPTIKIQRISFGYKLNLLNKTKMCCFKKYITRTVYKNTVHHVSVLY